MRKINCKNCHFELKVNSNLITKILNCSNCGCKLEIKLRTGNIFIFAIIPFFTFIFFSTLSSVAFEITLFIFTILIMVDFYLRPYKVRVLK